MPEPLTEQEHQTLMRVGEHVHGTEAEAALESLKLQGADESTLRAVLGDRAGTNIARSTALMLLLGKKHLRRDGALAKILLPLWDDPDEQLAEMAIQYSPPTHPDVAERLLATLDDPRPNRWSTAASVLARSGESAIIPRLLAWFREGDQDHRNVAYSCLCFDGLLEPDERRALLREAWDAGGRDDDDRTMLAVGLLELGDRDGWSFLVGLARRADHYSACWAAETIRKHDPALGLDLMRQILDRGTTFRVRWGMVEKIANAAGLPHLWTADGLAEARHWVEQRRLDANLI